MELAVVQDVEEWINHQLISKLGDTLQSIYLVGSYPSGKVSLNRPDINWLLVWKGFVSGIDLWTLGEILTSTIEKFRQGVVIRPEFRPFKFSYPIERGKDECFVNITVVSGAATTEDFKKKMSIERKGKNNPNWKGNNVQYTALHDWIRDNKHRIIICEKCKIHPSLDLANINHLYRRNIYEYIWLCRSCHMKYDYKKGFR